MTLAAAVTAAPSLQFELCVLESQSVIDWQAVQSHGIVPASGDTRSIPVFCYSGPAYRLSPAGLGSGSMLIEHSSNLVDWIPFPAAGFQLTFYPTSQPFLNIPTPGRAQYFRAVIK